MVCRRERCPRRSEIQGSHNPQLSGAHAGAPLQENARPIVGVDIDRPFSERRLPLRVITAFLFVWTDICPE